MMYYDDQYDDAIKWCIEEVINEIHRVKQLDNLAIEEVYYMIFQKEVEEAYQEYLDEVQQ